MNSTDTPKAKLPPRLTRIRVQKLFGTLDHDVALRKNERVTIVHGINGVGKTKLLELTAALTNGEMWRLAEVPFEQFEVFYDDGTSSRVTQKESTYRDDESALRASAYNRRRRRLPTKNQRELEIKRLSAHGVVLQSLGASDFEKERFRIRGLPPWVARVGQDAWDDGEGATPFSTKELQLRYGLPDALFDELSPSDKYREVVPCESAHLIETQRLLRLRSSRRRATNDEDEHTLVMTVRELAAELREKIAVVQNEFFKTTQALDRTLTARVLAIWSAAFDPESVGERLRERLQRLDAHRKRLEQVGLLDPGALSSFPPAAVDLSGDRAVMISVHTEDAEKKFRVLDPLATQLGLFIDGMNEKLASPKRLVLIGDRELAVQREQHMDQGEPGTKRERIALDQLSSGEQHELVLLYDLVFRVRQNTLVLIDEPELSLHPAWQQQLLPDMLKIAQTRAFDVILATHSPYVVGDRADLCVELRAEGAESRT